MQSLKLWTFLNEKVVWIVFIYIYILHLGYTFICIIYYYKVTCYDQPVLIVFNPRVELKKLFTYFDQ